MKELGKEPKKEKDSGNISSRKEHHLEMAKLSQVSPLERGPLFDNFDYEPLLSGFPDFNEGEKKSVEVGGKSLCAPLWISSMTGGTGNARHINKNLALGAKEFGLGLGLGSCRPLLESDEFFEDFNLRPLMGEKACLFANFGVAQVEKLLLAGEFSKIITICERLRVDGFFIHINPLQEFFQPEGDRWERPALDILRDTLGEIKGTGLFLGVKEVGQGMGPRSLEALVDLPVDIIEFAAFGGTNFSYLEGLRALRGQRGKASFSGRDLRYVGHSTMEMVRKMNDLYTSYKEKVEKGEKENLLHSFPTIIISGGIRSYLEGFALLKSLEPKGLYGMAMPFLEHAGGEYEVLKDFISSQLQGLKMAECFMKMRKD